MNTFELKIAGITIVSTKYFNALDKLIDMRYEMLCARDRQIERLEYSLHNAGEMMESAEEMLSEAETKIAAMSPRYSNDCPECKWIGRDGNLDVYSCPRSFSTGMNFLFGDGCWEQSTIRSYALECSEQKVMAEPRTAMEAVDDEDYSLCETCGYPLEECRCLTTTMDCPRCGEPVTLYATMDVMSGHCGECGVLVTAGRPTDAEIVAMAEEDDVSDRMDADDFLRMTEGE